MGMKALVAPYRVSTLQSVERARAMLKEANENSRSVSNKMADAQS